jgi:Family of unknown function (DUF695)
MIYTQDQWSVGHFVQNDAPMLVRARGTLPSKADREAYGHLILIKWPYTAGVNGMPNADDAERMQELELTLEANIEAQEVGIHALSLTGNGSREWRYYAHDTQEFMAALNRGLQGQEKFPIDLELLHDPEWIALAEFIGNQT